MCACVPETNLVRPAADDELVAEVRHLDDLGPRVACQPQKPAVDHHARVVNAHLQLLAIVILRQTEAKHCRSTRQDTSKVLSSSFN